MAPRTDVAERSNAVRAMYRPEADRARSGMERKLLHLIKTRVSPINGCGYCMDIAHEGCACGGRDRAAPVRLGGVQRATGYTTRDRRLGVGRDADADCVPPRPRRALRPHGEHYTEAELVGLTLAVIAVNGWNRIAIPSRG